MIHILIHLFMFQYFKKIHQFTNLIIYPNMSPSNLILKIDIYDESGKKVYDKFKFSYNKY